MSIFLHDTLTNTKRELKTVEPGKVRFYACGPTVYDHAHVGHARSYVVWDLVVRHLRARGLEVRYVRNFTDVDDKIIARANERGVDPVVLADGFAHSFDEDMAALGCVRPDVAPKVSEHVSPIVSLIATLVTKGFAYAPGNGDVYYSVRSFPEYGRLSRRNLDDLLSGARVEPGDKKRDPLDFALWKAAKPGEPFWESPWGKGRPGWHIECSAMTLAHLGVPIDIHAGGKDLIFPHHTNEIAQSAAAVGDGRTAETFARYWMHNGFVEIDNEKMSKSLGNFFTVKDVLKQYDPEVMRLFLLGTHYRNPINYSDLVLNEAERRLVYLYDTLDRADQLSQGVTPTSGEGIVEEARKALDDDFNAPQVLAVFAEAMTRGNAIADKKGKKTPEERASLAAFARDVREIGKTLGLFGREPAKALLAIRDRAAVRLKIDTASVEAKLALRTAARKEKDFAKSDAIRDELLSQGIAIMDGPAGTTWKIAG